MLRTALCMVVVVSLVSNAVDAARILGVFPYPSISHQVVFRQLTLELARRGHELVVFTTDPVNDPKLQNYTEISLNFFYEEKARLFNFVDYSKHGVWAFFSELSQFFHHIADKTLSHRKMQQLISQNSTKKFDLVFLQHIGISALLAIANRLDAPLIGISSLPASIEHHNAFGNQLLCASSPSFFLEYSDKMNFWERMHNCYHQIRTILQNYYVHYPRQDKIVKKYFGENTPHVTRLMRNVSMLFVNTQPYFIYPRPETRDILHIGGCRMTKRKSKELPPDLKRYLDGAKNGFIYFSLGSNVQSNQLPVETRNVLLKAFSKLPYRVIWKWEDDNLPGKPDNVFISKWLPQQEILEHPNVVLFIYQGGAQSTEEAIEYGVPLLGTPFFSDQEFNLKKVISLGFGKKINVNTMNDEEIKSTILEVITNTTYKMKILEFRELLHDRMNHPLDEAVFWTEHVIRHRGAPHLRSRSREMPMYQSELLDIFAFIFATLAIVLYVTYKIIRFGARLILIRLPLRLTSKKIKKT